jgi:hypothetical protein
MALGIKQTVRQDWLDRLNTLVGTNAKIRIYSGTRPATVDTALSGNTVLAELLLTTPSPFAAASVGEPTTVALNAISDDVNADATGTATFASILTSANVRVFDMSVGTSGADLNLNSTSIVANTNVAITSLTLALA